MTIISCYESNKVNIFLEQKIDQTEAEVKASVNQKTNLNVSQVVQEAYLKIKSACEDPPPELNNQWLSLKVNCLYPIFSSSLGIQRELNGWMKTKASNSLEWSDLCLHTRNWESVSFPSHSENG